MKFKVKVTKFRRIASGYRGLAKVSGESGLWTVQLTKEDGCWFAQPLVEEAPIEKGVTFSIFEGNRKIVKCKVLEEL